ncbi:MAG: S8 family serine peptidase [Proteobacteria bacterium]|nr:S8 family serine peptidase [Pseudomonadota bacterium]
MIFVDSTLRLLLTLILIPGIIGVIGPSVSPSFAAEEGSLRTQEQVIRIQGNRISIDVKNAAIRDVLREIAQKAKMDVVPGEGVSGEVTIQLTDVTIEEVLENLCRSRALVYEYLPDLNAYRIIRALAFGGADAKGAGGAATPASATSPGDNTEARRVFSGASAEHADGKPGSRISQGKSGGEGVSGETDDRARPLYKKGELLVRFKPGATDRQMEELHRSLGSSVLGTISKLRLQRIRLRTGLAEMEAMALYAASAIVEHAERHALRYPNRAANDPYADLQWGLANIHAGEAWDITPGKPAVVIAVIDTGVDYQHPDLRGNIWINAAEIPGNGIDDDGNGYVDDIRGWDFAGNDAINPVADNDPMDVDGHGTHIAGIIAASGNNGLGIAGINWQARIMPLKVQADNSNSFLEFAIIEAIQYAIDQGAKIVNSSFGGSAGSAEEEGAFTALKDAGVLAVCAAGNSTQNTDVTANYPAGYPLDNIISVAASGSDDKLASFSNWGPTSVDLMAPGVSIYSTTLESSGTDARVRVAGSNPVEYAALGMEYAGRTGENGITGTAYNCGQGYTDQFPDGVTGYIALIQRGNRDGNDFYFDQKVQNAQVAGAKGVIIYNNRVPPDSFDASGGTLGSPGDWVPAVSITKAAGEALIALGSPTVTLINRPVIYAYMNGTSMAAPHVAGVAGLLLAQCPSLSYTGIKSAILDTADPIGSVADKMVSGGRVNAFAALKSLLLPADLTGDCRIGLNDAVLALQLLSGLPPPVPYPCAACGKGVTGDDKIGLQEAIFILQTAAELR